MLLRKPPLAASRDVFETFPAPTRGLNLRDSKSAMKVRDALILENWFPEQTSIRLRGGRAAHVTGFTSTPESLMEWSGPSSSKFFAAAGTSLYDITTAGVLGSSALSSLGNARFSHVQFTNSAGDDYLVIANGATGVREYNGSAWSTPTINNVSSADLNFVTTFKHRVWFVKKNSTEAWYLDTDAIQGDAHKFDVGAEFRRGGYLRMIGSLSHDAGDGVDDYLAFFSSNGEIVVYQGTDPSDADAFAVVGRFPAGRPIGDRALLQVGGDLSMIGADGVVSVMQMLKLDRSQAYKASVSNRIDPALSEDFRNYSANTGWQAILHPRGHMALVNVPISATRAWQWVVNTQTGAWCRFRDHHAYVWGLFDDELYFGGADTVYKAESGYSDAGAAIVGRWMPAFQAFATGRKTFKMWRPLYRSNGNPGIAMRLNLDYAEVRPSAANAVAGPTNNLWGGNAWGATVWGGMPATKTWRACTGSGFVAAPHVLTSTAGARIEFDGIDVLFEAAQGTGT